MSVTHKERVEGLVPPLIVSLLCLVFAIFFTGCSYEANNKGLTYAFFAMDCLFLFITLACWIAMSRRFTDVDIDRERSKTSNRTRSEWN